MVLLFLVLALLVGHVDPARPLAPIQTGQVVESSREQHKQHVQQQQHVQGAESISFPGSPSGVSLHLAFNQPSLLAQAQAPVAVLNAQALASDRAKEQGARPDMQATSISGLTDIIEQAALSKSSHQGLQLQQATTLAINGTGMAQQPQLPGMPSSASPLPVPDLSHVPQLPSSMRALTQSRPRRYKSRTLAMADDQVPDAHAIDTCLVVVEYHATRAGARPGNFTATLDMKATPEVRKPS